MTGQKFVRVLLLGYGGAITGAALTSDVQPTRKRRMNLHDGVDDVAIFCVTHGCFCPVFFAASFREG